MFIGKKKAQTSRELSQKFEQQNNHLYDATWEHIHQQEIIPFLNKEKVFQHYDQCHGEFTTTLLKSKKNGNAVQSFAMIGTNILLVITVLIGGFFSTLSIIDLADIYGLILVVPIICTALFNLPNLLFTYEMLKGGQNILRGFYELPLYDDRDKTLLVDEIKRINLQIEEMGYEGKEPLFSRISIMNHGNIIADGSYEGVKNRLSKTYTYVSNEKQKEILIQKNPRNLILS